MIPNTTDPTMIPAILAFDNPEFDWPHLSGS
ncbi:hypothetical protein PPL_11892 [Heterostelium album PN500]|uniref:Uncharacterized protein n=1 Tax=Heterostelium pallidum (strain ATCC 26659 / Pp 5 / PN500) TaxID=670386 RepID=D3BUS0_HETP5|nr:hypothetical protein PPL_11892 [Heterostelium album PN500]EFA74858.1 hypothetical protein PPL_11892 [Heterostelium album PN500]|eukprot:XP_020426992.1 hypothetical protein PPL_11892 [Heterostelium album PN500]